MALQQNFSTSSGIQLTDAYFRIDAFRGDTVRLTIGVYVSPTAREERKDAVASIEVSLPTPNTSSNMFADAYMYLKTLPEFSEAVDV